MKPASLQNQPQKIQFWIIWIAMLAGLPVMQIFVGGGWPEGDDQGDLSSGQLAIMAGGVFASTLVRWIVLPRIKNPQTLLTTMVIGLALAEATWFLGMFMISGDFPDTQRSAFVLSFLGMCQFVPTYAAGLSSDPDNF